MTVATQVEEVALPEGAREQRARLEAEGWTVSLRLAWCAEARRGHDFEQAVGRSPGEALAELCQLTSLDVPPGGV